MYFIKVDSLETADKLCKINEKFKNVMDVDINYGRQTVDGCSILGITSLIGNIVKIMPIVNEKINTEEYYEELIKIGAYEV